jgi:hypothetical protein
MTDVSLQQAVKALDRIAMILAALYAERLEGKTLGEKAGRLQPLGFSNAQIAHVLGSTEGAVQVARSRHGGRRRRGSNPRRGRGDRK